MDNRSSQDKPGVFRCPVCGFESEDKRVFDAHLETSDECRNMVSATRYLTRSNAGGKKE